MKLGFATTLFLSLLLPVPSQTAENGDWPTYHRDNARSGYLKEMADPQRLAVAWNTRLDGAVYAEPLVIGGHIFAATENNTVYSLDPQNGHIEWQTHIAPPVPRSKLPCGNINPLGITGTPAYDSATGTLFAVAETTGPSHLLIGLDIKTGQIRNRRPAEPPSGPPAPHQERAALLVHEERVYIAYGGLYGDCGDYHGTIMAARTDGSNGFLLFQVPTRREGGIWAAAGPVMDANGNLFAAVGNGAAEGNTWDQTDSVMRLSSLLQIRDAFAPDRWAQDNRNDEDLGSLSPVLLPNERVFIAGKSGIGYLLRANHLGGVGGQLTQKPFCHAFGGAAVVGNEAFVPCNEGLQELRLDGPSEFTLGWRAADVQGSPVVGGNTVYSVDRRGALNALDMTNGKVRAKVELGDTSRFATPTLYQNRIFVGTMSGVVAVNPS